MIKFPITIVGGGPAGCSAAIFLARNGFDVKLYEQDTERVKPCGGGLSWRLIKEFKDFLHKVPSFDIRGAEFDIEGNIYDIDFKKKVGCIVDRFVFDKNLREMVKNEGVKIINKKIERFSKNGVCIDARGYKKSNNPLIAIRGICKAKRGKMLFVLKRKIVKFGYFWVFPMEDDLVNIGVAGRVKSFNINPIEAFNWFVKEKNLKPFDVATAPICCEGKIKNLVDRNVIKVGEAAGLVSPLIGEGIYYAMKSGKMAADCIKDNKVDNYEKMVKNEFEKEFKISLLIGSVFVNSPIVLSKLIFKFGIKYVESKILGL